VSGAGNEESGSGVPARPPDGEPPEDLVFRYVRSRRIERGPPSLRWLESRRTGRRPGILSPLFANRSTRLLLFTIVGLAIAFYGVSLLTGPRGSGRLGSELYTAKAFYFEGRVLVGISRRVSPSTPRQALPETGGLVRVQAKAGERSGTSSFARSAVDREDWRLAFDLPGAKPLSVAVHVETESGALDLVATVD